MLLLLCKSHRSMGLSSFILQSVLEFSLQLRVKVKQSHYMPGQAQRVPRG